MTVMTVKEFADAHGIEIVGKLTKKVSIREDYSVSKGFFTVKETVYEDEEGNAFVIDDKGMFWVDKDGMTFI